MDRQRLETFGDVIIAIVLTILALKLANQHYEFRHIFNK